MAPSGNSTVQEGGSTPVTAIGSGYSTFLGSAMQTILDVKTDPGLGSTAASVYVCKTTQQIYDALEINSSLAVSSPWGSFADKLNLINTLNTNTTSVVIIATATVVKNSWTVSGATFKSAYDKASAVYKQGGDSYVSYIATGGQFIAAYAFVAYDEETYQELSNVADASFPGTFDASFETNIQNMSKSTGVSYHSKYKGIGYTGLMPNPADIVQYVLAFGTITLDAPEVLDFSTRSYGDVPKCPDFTQIDAYRTAYYDPTSTSLAYIDFWLLAKTNLDIISNVVRIYETYGFLAKDPKLTSVPLKLNSILESIATWRQTVDKDPTNPNIDPPTIDEQSLTYPTPQYSIVPSSPVGNFSASDGNSFRDVDDDMIQRGVLPKTVQICGGGVINRLITTYTQYDDDNPTFTLTRGGNDGTSYPPVELGPGEKITQITTLWDDHICRMSITTTSQAGVLYPYNQDGPNKTTWSTPTDGSQVFIGWQGTSDDAIDGLQALYVQFQPANWQMSTTNKKPVQQNTPLKKAASNSSGLTM